MKQLIFLLLCLGISASAADQIFAVVIGTNVVDVTQYDPARRPKILAGTTHVAIAASDASEIKLGWTYSDGVFRNPARQPISAEVTAKKERETKAKAFKAIYEIRKKNWDTIKALEQADVLGQLCAVIDMILELHPELLEPKPESGN